MAKKTILIRLNPDDYDTIHKLMGYSLVSDNITIEKMHYGTAQDFYRRLIMSGIARLKEEWDAKVKKYESEDSN